MSAYRLYLAFPVLPSTYYRIRVKTNARELKSKQRDAICGSRVYTEMNIYRIKDVCPFYNIYIV